MLARIEAPEGHALRGVEAVVIASDEAYALETSVGRFTPQDNEWVSCADCRVRLVAPLRPEALQALNELVNDWVGENRSEPGRGDDFGGQFWGGDCLGLLSSMLPYAKALMSVSEMPSKD